MSPALRRSRSTGFGPSRGALRLAPASLSEEAVSSLVRARFPSASTEVCAAFNDATAGNPLLLRELLLAVSADGALSEPDPVGAVRETSIAPIGDRVVRRIARVGPQSPALAWAMAVLGGEGSLELASALGEITAWLPHADRNADARERAGRRLARAGSQ